MGQLYGYTGRLLRVDLSNERIYEEKLDEETARKYIGGSGLGAYYLYKEVPAGVEWNDEANRLIMASGPLGGTTVGGSGTVSIITKGPLTNGAIASQANGFFGAYIRFSGYEGIIFQGIAKRLAYLYINNGKAELRDASNLAGKNIRETNELIQKELGYKKREISIASIGPAGENLVKYAGILTDGGHIASHGGIGAVMGNKKLKAVAIARSKSRPVLKDKESFNAVAKQLLSNIIDDPAIRSMEYEWGTLKGIAELTETNDGTIPVKNYTSNVFDIEPEKLDKFRATYIRGHTEPKPEPCWACRFHHCHSITLTEGPYKDYVGEEPEYECFASFGPVIGVTDATAAIYLANEADLLGLDANETGWTLGLIMECFEKGLLTSKDAGGIELTWGNHEAAHKMMLKIANREGFGDILAEGVMRAAQHIGGDAPNYAIHTMKGSTPRTHDHRTRWPMLFDTCLSQTGTDEGFKTWKPADLGLSSKPNFALNTSPEDTIAWNAQYKGMEQFDDCLGACRFNIKTDVKLLAEAVSAATGWDFSTEEAVKVSKCITNLYRVFNIRHGHTPEMDAPSPRYGSAPPDGPAQGKTILPVWDQLRSRYYEQMGWDKNTGKPLPETLKSLGLDYTIPELWGNQGN